MMRLDAADPQVPVLGPKKKNADDADDEDARDETARQDAGTDGESEAPPEPGSRSPSEETGYRPPRRAG
jgi:hypothetical protein